MSQQSNNLRARSGTEASLAQIPFNFLQQTSAQPLNFQTGVQPTTFQTGVPSTTFQQGGQPNAFQQGGQPNAFQQGGQPNAFQQGGQPNAFQQGGQPNAFQQGGQPNAFQQGGQPVPFQTGVPSTTFQTGAQPNAFQQGGQPVPFQIGVPSTTFQQGGQSNTFQQTSTQLTIPSIWAMSTHAPPFNTVVKAEIQKYFNGVEIFLNNDIVSKFGSYMTGIDVCILYNNKLITIFLHSDTKNDIKDLSHFVFCSNRIKCVHKQLRLYMCSTFRTQPSKMFVDLMADNKVYPVVQQDQSMLLRDLMKMINDILVDTSVE